MLTPPITRPTAPDVTAPPTDNVAAAAEPSGSAQPTITPMGFREANAAPYAVTQRGPVERTKRTDAQATASNPAEGPDDSHVDNSWDAFKRGFTDSLKNPVGWTAGQIVEAAGGSKEQIELAKAFGDSPFGEGLAQLSKKLGATDEQANTIRGLGKAAEGFIPGYGGARFAAGLIADVVTPSDVSMGPTELAEINAQFKLLPGYRPGKNAPTETPTPLPRIKQITPQPSPTKSLQPAPTPGTGELHDRAVSVDLQKSPAMTSGVQKGTHVVDGKTYIPIDGKTFEVRYDRQLNSWKIIDPENPYAFDGGQPVRLNEQGQWQRLTRPGLRGGNDSDSWAGSSSRSNASTSGDYSPHADPVIRDNPFRGEVTLSEGARLNSRGIIERTDFKKLYRVEKTDRVDRRGDPTEVGFRDSNWFGGVEKMLDDEVVIMSASKEAAMHYGESEFGNHYSLYEIDAEGLPAASLTENVEHNAAFMELRDGYEPGAIAKAKASNMLRHFAHGAYEFDEVHVSNLPLEPGRIKQIAVS